MADTPSCPMSRARVVDTYFMEHRAKLLDIAAFLDRLERSGGEGSESEDARVSALRAALRLLDDGEGQRVRRILELLSDLSSEPLDVAPGKGACGVATNRDYAAEAGK